MIEFQNGGRMIQSLSELPDFRNAKVLYQDVETTSGDSDEPAWTPYDGRSKLLGIAATVDDCPYSVYVPMRHKSGQNLDPEKVMDWVRDNTLSCEIWVNHNVKFDAHFIAEEGVDLSQVQMIDTIAHAKLIDSDRLGYDLGVLANDWLGKDISKYEVRLKEILSSFGRRASKDYGDVPADIIAEYACEDVLSNRGLWKHLLYRKREESNMIWRIESQLTPALFDIERVGMFVHRPELIVKNFKTLSRMVQLEEELHGLIGWPIRPHTSADCFEFIVNQHGLPVLNWTEKGEASFKADVLLQYMEHPLVKNDSKLIQAFERILEYRELHTLQGLFIDTFLRLERDGFMHPDYNQSVRTGRMSCRKPNAQQNSKEAKALIHPPPGMGILSCDYSQIEFRLIIHYIRNQAAIEAYAKDPWTDFHTWVAEMCEINRKPAKNINFAMGYGGGKKKVVKMLANEPTLITNLYERIDQLVAEGKADPSQRMTAFKALAEKRGEDVYAKYHGALPELKSTSKQAEFICKSRGYVKTLHGRCRNMPAKLAWKAFNNVTQGEAADITKERVVALSPRFNPVMRELGVNIFAVVHDEIAFYGPTEVLRDDDVKRRIVSTMESTELTYRVPIKASCGYSEVDWSIASGDEGVVKL